MQNTIQDTAVIPALTHIEAGAMASLPHVRLFRQLLRTLPNDCQRVGRRTQRRVT